MGIGAKARQVISASELVLLGRPPERPVAVVVPARAPRKRPCPQPRSAPNSATRSSCATSMPGLPAAAPLSDPASIARALRWPSARSRPDCGRPASWNGSARIVCGTRSQGRSGHPGRRPSNVSRLDPAGVVQVDAEHPARTERWSADAMTSEIPRRFKRWFWRPPRAHGEVIADRQVSNLELFYDLVYVAVIGQAAHHLAEHVTVRGLAEFAFVFALIWIAWINGSLYLELHGREDGRTRSIVFAQMSILVLLAVFTADAADGSGRGFAVVYATYQVVQTGLWYSVWRQDRRDYSEYQALAGAGRHGRCGGGDRGQRPAGGHPTTSRVGRPWGRLDRWHRAGRPELPRRLGSDPHRLAGRALRAVHHHRPRRGRARGRGWPVRGPA